MSKLKRIFLIMGALIVLQGGSILNAEAAKSGECYYGVSSCKACEADGNTCATGYNGQLMCCEN